MLSKRKKQQSVGPSQFQNMGGKNVEDTLKQIETS